MATLPCTMAMIGFPTSGKRICGVGKAIARISRRIGSTVIILSGMTLLLAGLSGSGFATERRHEGGPDAPYPPRTALERRLDQILRDGDRNPSLVDQMTGRQAAGPKGEGRLRGYFTPPLLKSIGDFERKLVQKNCDGTYRTDDICGMDASPLNCAQDEPSYGYRFETEYSTPVRAIVAVSWLENGPVVSRYRLVKDGQIWKVDGIQCGAGGGYNW